MKAPRCFAVTADRVFDGTTWHEHSAVVIEGSQIQQIVSRIETPAMPITILPEGIWLAPGFIDTQVNGGGDVLFNDCPTAETISVIAAAHRKFGTTGFLPTLITDTPEKTSAAIAAVHNSMRVQPAVLGLHLEGPFLSRDKAGVHDPAFIRVPTSADLDILTAPRSGALVVTLAPEQVPAQFIARLAASGARVCLGHSMATYAQTRAAIGEGLSGFTHLFNAMRQLESRNPGPIAAALESASCSYGLIVDGVHVDPAMLRLALRGLGNPMLVTDAMPPVGGARSTFLLYNEEIRIEQGRCIRSDGTLAGTFLDMASAVRNCVRLLGLSLHDALRLASVNPAAFLGIKTGRLAPGFRADMIAFEPREIEVHRTWIAGAEPDASD